MDNVVLSTLSRETLLPLESGLYDVRFRPKEDAWYVPPGPAMGQLVSRMSRR